MDEERGGNLKVLPYYTGDQTVEQAPARPAGVRLLWLEILFNSETRWAHLIHLPQVKEAYEKACVWYGCFKTIIEGHAGPSHLTARPGTIDEREYRRFLEVLNFVSRRT
jgi:hypothetical protein